MSVGIEEAARRVEISRSGSDRSVSRYSDIDTSVVMDMPVSYTAGDERVNGDGDNGSDYREDR